MLVGILLPALGSAQQAAWATQSLSNIRQLGQSIYSFAANSSNYVFPTTQMYNGTPYFEVITASGYEQNSLIHRCPNDEAPGWDTNTRITSYPLNGYFAPNHDPYGQPGQAGSGINLGQVSQPNRTIMIAEIAEYRDADHFMPMYWGATGSIHPRGMMGNIPRMIVRKRHGQGANYAFADGHANLHPFTDTWNDATTDASTRLLDWYDPKFDN